ncbi:MAG: DUF4393 domain-containing protein [Patescibacteria group bacterium]|nr:DUF4393 domain-containing protein [Patescibacteria group bacterium]MDD5294563.1 DUF4393 domain-containing protein [Patescibacteria group bacterium]MDD5554930.1 DUF4393 domain-containing protein [Patescibacteria group bacterium]
MSDDDKITQAAKAVEGIVKAVPVYQDALQPAAKQIGKGLETITKTINIALAPVSALVWGYEKISVFLSAKLTDKLKNVPPERIVTPNLLVAGPVVESLRFAAHEETLRELYANLLATSIDSATAQNAHPGFVQIIQNMSPDEARVLKFFTTGGDKPLIDVRANVKDGYRILYRNFSHIGKKAGCEHQQLLPNYLDNLCRLGLLEIPPMVHIVAEGLYEELESDKALDPIKKQVEAKEGWTLSFNRKEISLTTLGKQFCLACVIDKDLQVSN